MKTKKSYYTVTVRKVVVMEQTYILEATSRKDAAATACDMASEINASTKDSDWKIKELRKGV